MVRQRCVQRASRQAVVGEAAVASGGDSVSRWHGLKSCALRCCMVDARTHDATVWHHGVRSIHVYVLAQRVVSVSFASRELSCMDCHRLAGAGRNACLRAILADPSIDKSLCGSHHCAPCAGDLQTRMTMLLPVNHHGSRSASSGLPMSARHPSPSASSSTRTRASTRQTQWVR